MEGKIMGLIVSTVLAWMIIMCLFKHSFFITFLLLMPTQCHATL